MRVWRDVKDASGGGILKSEDSIGTTSNGYHLLYTTFALQRMLAAWPYKTAVFLLLLAAASLDVFVIQEGYLEPVWVVGASICLQGLLTLDLALHAVSRYPLVSEYLANKWVLLDWCLMVAIWLVTGYYWEYSIGEHPIYYCILPSPQFSRWPPLVDPHSPPIIPFLWNPL